MDKIPNIDTPYSSETSKSEKRRETRRMLESEMQNNRPDRIQLNDLMLALMVVFAAAISFTDFTISFDSIRDLTALSLFLYIVTTLVYRNRYEKGKMRGKLDREYLEALRIYREKIKEIHAQALNALVPEFCRNYKIKELREYRESLLTDIEMDYTEYREKYHRMSLWSIIKLNYSWSVKRCLMRCNNAKPIRLTPGLILNENGEMNRQKLLGQSGPERERKDKKKQVIERGIIVLFGSVIAVDIIFDFSILNILQWLVRMIPVISAIIMGDDSGYCNITVTEVNFKRDQSKVIDIFLETAKDLAREKSPQEKSTKDE